jgi:hypothetical protein
MIIDTGAILLDRLSDVVNEVLRTKVRQALQIRGYSS